MEEEEKIRKLFEKYDENKNGVLDKGEFRKVFKKILMEMGENFPEKKHDQVVEEGLQNFDLNQNGTIEYEEFVEVINFLFNEKGYELK